MPGSRKNLEPLSGEALVAAAPKGLQEFTKSEFQHVSDVDCIAQPVNSAYMHGQTPFSDTGKCVMEGRGLSDPSHETRELQLWRDGRVRRSG